ncbi:MAG TPA: hypothetical protein VNA15_03225 [Candidatus Angelobacter sp.]|nr:hypothetical protein [Candidatus Angelobacter sp.]
MEDEAVMVRVDFPFAIGLTETVCGSKEKVKSLEEPDESAESETSPRKTPSLVTVIVEFAEPPGFTWSGEGVLAEML